MIGKFVDTFTSIVNFKSHIMSFLEYGSVFLECLPLSFKTKLQRLQNKCLRVCHCSERFTSNYELHRLSHVLPLSLRRKISTCLLMYKKIQADPKIFHKSDRIGNRSGGTFVVTVPKPNKESFS